MSKFSSASSSSGFRSDKINQISQSNAGTDIQGLNNLINSILAGNSQPPATPGATSAPKVG